MESRLTVWREYCLLGVLALLWGSSYLFIKIAVVEIPPLTLIALRVAGAAVFLLAVMQCKGDRLPRDRRTWRLLFNQAIFNSIGAWTVLAWGQQFVDAGLASVLNSTSPVFVFIFAVVFLNRDRQGMHRFLGAVAGLFGVCLIVGTDALRGLGQQVLGQLACLGGAALYAVAAIHGRRFRQLSAVSTAAGTMLWATAALTPIALFVDRPWRLQPSLAALSATLILSVFCTGVALMIYFRLAQTIGSMGVASQSYLRAGVGVLLGFVVLGETASWQAIVGLLAAICGVALINWPAAGMSEAVKQGG